MKILFKLFLFTEAFFAVLLFMLCTGGFILFPLFEKYIPSTLELPVGHPNGIAADSQGRVYLIEAASRRIQVFDKNGKFINGWFVVQEKRNEEFKLKIDAQDNLHVFVNCMNFNACHYVFDPKGNLLSKEAGDVRANGMLNYNGETSYKDIAGNSYSLEGPKYVYRGNNGYAYTFSKVYKTDLSGNKSLVVSRPFYMWLVTTPLLPWFFVSGIFFAFVLRGAAEMVIKAKAQKKQV